MSSKTYLLFAFDSTNYAIAGEKVLKPLGAVVMPILREITASCGMAIRLTPEKEEEAVALLDSSDIPSWYLYRITQEGKKNSFEKIR